MPKYISPLKPPRIKQPSDDPTGGGEFRLDGAELYLRDLYAQEPVNISGTVCELFTRNIADSIIDPLYGEPSETAWDGPYRLFASVEWPEATPEVVDEGLRQLWPSGVWIPRKTIEDVQARAPREGDILRFWELPFFDEMAGRRQPGSNAAFYFDIIQVNDDGHSHDDSAFVAFRCDLKRRSDAPPELSFHPEVKPGDDC